MPESPSPADYIGMESGFTKDLMPLVRLSWGEHQTALTPAEVREHAMALLESAACAEMDTAIMRWAGQTLEMPPEQAQGFVAVLRQARAEGEMPSCTLNLGEESITPDEARDRASYLIANSFNTEAEAVIALLLIEAIGVEPDQVSPMIEDLRQIRGLKTDWEREGLG